MSFEDILKEQLVNSVEGASSANTEGQPQVPVEGAKTDASVEQADPRLDVLKGVEHGQRIGNYVVFDSTKGVDVTQFESGKSLQRNLVAAQNRLKEYETKIAESTRLSAEATAKAEKEAAEGKLRNALQRAASIKDPEQREKAKVSAVLEYKNWEKAQIEKERDELRNRNTQSQESQEIQGIIREWNEYYVQDMGYDPGFIRAVSYRALQQTGDNPVEFQNLRHDMITEMTALAARGQLKDKNGNPMSPFRSTPPTNANGDLSTPNSNISQPAALTPSENAGGTPNLMDMFQNGDLAKLKQNLNMRR